MAKPGYMVTGVDADLARLIKDGALFLRPVGSTAPTGTTWSPTTGDEQVGYYSDEGFTLTPTPGDETTLTGHNGDPLIAEAAPGYWAVGFSGLEGNETVTAAYFDADVDPVDGSVTVSSASASRRYDLIAVGLDQRERLILVHFPNVQLDIAKGVQSKLQQSVREMPELKGATFPVRPESISVRSRRDACPRALSSSAACWWRSCLPRS